jgi:hypothetical protein
LNACTLDQPVAGRWRADDVAGVSADAQTGVGCGRFSGGFAVIPDRR